jgi:tetratricopeptide (TPR) repeat protein
MARVALLIGVSEYEPGLNSLPGSVMDVDAMRRVLVHPELGGFVESDVATLKNPQRQEMEDAIYRLFANRKKDDLLLFYFSGHGIKDETGKLYLASRNTRKENGNLFKPSAVATSSVHENINGSRSQHQVIILDCCFSGAIAQGMTIKDDGTVNLKEYLGGKGRAILTSSTSTEYSFGADVTEYENAGLSIYTRYLVEGIEKGTADVDGDGWIEVEELHEYVSSQIRKEAPAMTPKFYPVEEGFKIRLSKSPKDDPKLKYRKEVQVRAEQGQGKFSVFAQKILEDKCREWNISFEEAEVIQNEVLQPYREYERKLREYEQVLMEGIKIEYPFSELTESDLKDYQQHLGLRDSDIDNIRARVLAAHKQSYQGEDNVLGEQPLNKPKLDDPLLEEAEPPKDKSVSSFTISTAELVISSEPYVRAYRKGWNKLRYGFIDEAITAFQEALQLNPNLLDAYRELGRYLIDQGKLGEAVSTLQKGLEIASSNKELNTLNAELHTLLGRAFREQNKLNEALSEFQEAIQAKPDYAEAHFQVGVVLRRQSKENLSKLDEAVVAFQKVIEVEPNHARAHVLLGIVFREKGELDEAVTEFQKAINLNAKDSYNLLYLQGDIFKQQRKMDEATTAYQKAVELNPDFQDAYKSLGVSLFGQGSLDEAAVALRKAIQLDTNDVRAYRCLGLILDAQGNLDKAIEAYRTVIQLESNNLKDNEKLTDLLIRRTKSNGNKSTQDEIDELTASLYRCTQLGTNDGSYFYLLGIFLRKQNKSKEADAAYEKAKRLGFKPPMFLGALNFLGII